MTPSVAQSCSARLARSTSTSCGNSMVGREAGGAAVAAAALGARDRGDVDAVVGRAQRHLAPLRLGRSPEQVADEAGHRGALERAQVVDDALGVALVGAGGGVVLARQVRDASAARRRSARRCAEPAREQLELALRHALEEAAVDRVHVDARPRSASAAIWCARGPGVLVHELAGVGDEPDVERLGDRAASSSTPEALHQVPDHLGGARRLRHDVVDGPEAACCRGGGRR